jgi:hypothetical protein
MRHELLHLLVLIDHILSHGAMRIVSFISSSCCEVASEEIAKLSEP